ncbi:hypothetical protein F2Q70_00010564 [Brassica cretica]|uniref:Uncharacterized protein n=1 Tax=Brassica cretica TaxID=69181 RepID=A0A8S9M9F2_BRACR|nr:hypothetical protein F2Q70_00010564 [Brassica cretica]
MVMEKDMNSREHVPLKRSSKELVPIFEEHVEGYDELNSLPAVPEQGTAVPEKSKNE